MRIKAFGIQKNSYRISLFCVPHNPMTKVLEEAIGLCQRGLEFGSLVVQT